MHLYRARCDKTHRNRAPGLGAQAVPDRSCDCRSWPVGRLLGVDVLIVVAPLGILRHCGLYSSMARFLLRCRACSACGCSFSGSKAGSFMYMYIRINQSINEEFSDEKNGRAFVCSGHGPFRYCQRERLEDGTFRYWIGLRPVRVQGAGR